mmetsp:Transcript_22303/g.19162  ORF Transcript_22303/g.19162 Transcript_22303/m.19162 type:complete len:344 (-) Transcript_22303:326-1357(-)
MDSLLISPVMSERILVGSNCSFLVDSLLKVILGSVNSVGEDGLDLLDDGDFVSSLGRVSFVVRSPFVALFSLLLETLGGGSQFLLGGVLGGSGVSKIFFVFSEFSSGLFEELLEVSDLSEELSFQLFESSNSGIFRVDVVALLGFGGFSQGLHNLDGSFPVFLGEGGGNLGQSSDGVALSDLAEGEEGCFEFQLSFGLVSLGNELLDDKVNSIEDTIEFVLSDGEFFSGNGVSISGRLKLFSGFLEISFSVGNLVLEGFNNLNQFGDLLSGFGNDSVGNFDSSVVFSDGLGAFGFSLSLELVSFSLLSFKVSLQVGKESGDISKGSLVLDLEGNGIEKVLSET